MRIEDSFIWMNKHWRSVLRWMTIQQANFFQHRLGKERKWAFGDNLRNEEQVNTRKTEMENDGPNRNLDCSQKERGVTRGENQRQLVIFDVSSYGTRRRRILNTAHQCKIIVETFWQVLLVPFVSVGWLLGFEIRSRKPKIWECKKFFHTSCNSQHQSVIRCSQPNIVTSGAQSTNFSSSNSKSAGFRHKFLGVCDSQMFKVSS